MKYEFLSPEWIRAAREIRDEYVGRVAPAALPIRMNQCITGGPNGEDILSHLDTSSGRLVMDLGHLDDAEVTITTDYETARLIFVDQDAQGAMAAFMGGKIKVEGDMSKLLAMQTQQADPLAVEIAGKVKEITEH